MRKSKKDNGEKREKREKRERGERGEDNEKRGRGERIVRKLTAPVTTSPTLIIFDMIN